VTSAELEINILDELTQRNFELLIKFSGNGRHCIFW
jgi:hypothetical protein